MDENISSFKSEHLLPDVQAASSLYMAQSAENKKELLTLNTQLSTARYILKELKERFPVFLKKNLSVNPMKCEYFLPFVVDELLGEKRATVKVLKSMDKWYGVTYKEDKPVVVAAIQNLKDGGLYPQRLWEE